MSIASASKAGKKKPAISFQDVEAAEAELTTKASKSRIGVSASSRLYAAQQEQVGAEQQKNQGGLSRKHTYTSVRKTMIRESAKARKKTEHDDFHDKFGPEAKPDMFISQPYSA